MKELIEKLEQLPRLQLPRGGVEAVWLEDVIRVVEKHYQNKDK